MHTFSHVECYIVYFILHSGINMAFHACMEVSQGLGGLDGLGGPVTSGKFTSAEVSALQVLYIDVDIVTTSCINIYTHTNLY